MLTCFQCIVLIFGLCPLALSSAERPLVPNRFVFCMTQVSLSAEAQALVQEQVDRIQKNALAHQVLIERALIHFPVIEDALFRIGVPDDFKYLAIQESGLRGEAVSISNAVGYWQFKDFTAREVGLRITAQIDERKHLFRSTVGAARYLAKNYFRHRNWLYAVISYYAGGSGAIPYIKDEFIGVDYIELDSTAHWYLIKAIAHKYAFEHRLKENLVHNLPWLEPMDCQGETEVARLQQQSGNPEDVFRQYNRWILSRQRLNEANISYYALREGNPRRRVADPYAHLYPAELNGWQPKWRTEFDQTIEQRSLATPRTDSVKHPSLAKTDKPCLEYQEITIEQDPNYGKDYVLLTTQFNLIDISLKYGIKLQRLREWNRIKPHVNPAPGKFICLQPPRKARVWIADELETLEDIASLVGRSAQKLRQLNRLPDQHGILKTGQKIYLREERPESEPIVIVVKGKVRETELNTSKPNLSTTKNETVPSDKLGANPESVPSAGEKKRSPLLYDVSKTESVQSFQTNQPLPLPKAYQLTEPSTTGDVIHTVLAGETLWSIAQRYGLTVETLRLHNRLQVDHILRIGDQLIIPPKP